MNNKQPEALRLAAWLDRATFNDAPMDCDIAAELRRLHALNGELVEALRRLVDRDLAYSGNCVLQGQIGYYEVLSARAVLAKAEAQQ